MALTERAQWLTDFFKERAQEWIELSTEDLIEEYRKAFPEESPTPGYIGSQLEALEQMGLITIDRPDYGQRRPTRYLWSGGNGAKKEETVDQEEAQEKAIDLPQVEPEHVNELHVEPSQVEMPKVEIKKPLLKEVTQGGSVAEKKLAEMEEFISLIKDRIGGFENAARDLRKFVQEQGEVIERQIILDDPNLDYRLETIKVKKK